MDGNADWAKIWVIAQHKLHIHEWLHSWPSLEILLAAGSIVGE